MRPTVGIVTRTKDRPVLLKRALDSIVNQSFQEWNLVIVNDGGDSAPVDKLLEYYESVAKHRIKVIHNSESHGMEAASNLGIAALDCEYLAIHDDDDSWAPEFLSITLSELEHTRKQFPTTAAMLAMANSVFERVDRNLVIVEHTEPYKPWVNRGPLSLDAMLIENQFAPIQALWRMDAAKDVGLFRESLLVLGDWEFNIRFMLKYEIGIIPQTLAFYHHRIDDSGIYGNSIYAASTRHQTYAQLLRNEWLRNDIAKGQAGIGTFGSIRIAIQNVQWKAETLEARLDVLDRIYSELAEIPAKLSNHKPALSQIPQSGQLSISKIWRLFILWLRSSSPIRDARRAFAYWWKNGYCATIARIEEWRIAKER
jgi:glycosyltransferase involved in cell wall biosynthesis